MRYRRSTASGASYFFTAVTDQRRKLFSDPNSVALFMAAVSKTVERRPFVVDAYVVLPDHVHMVWTLPENDADFSTRWRQLKEAFTRQYLRTNETPQRSKSKELKGEHAIWQRRFWEHLIRNEKDFAAHIYYIHHNPVHHGLVASPNDWPFSSFSDWVSRGTYTIDWRLADYSGIASIENGE